MNQLYVPFCGAPPVPATLWQGWTLDPWLLAGLAVVGAVPILRWQQGVPPGHRAWLAGVTGWLLLAASLVSPLCNLSVALFAAREAQHVVLLLVAAPLLAAACLGPGLRNDGDPQRGLATSTVLFGTAFWFWHAPAAYDASLRGDLAYAAMHVSMIGTAVLFWRGLFRAWQRRPHLAALAALVTTIHMGVLGALLTLAPRALYASHLDTTLPWGLTPIEDQQLGGLVMWVPGGLVLLAVSLGGLARWLVRTEDETEPAGWMPVMVEPERR